MPSASRLIYHWLPIPSLDPPPVTAISTCARNTLSNTLISTFLSVLYITAFFFWCIAGALYKPFGAYFDISVRWLTDWAGSKLHSLIFVIFLLDRSVFRELELETYIMWVVFRRIYLVLGLFIICVRNDKAVLY